jgi:CDGSH-type Zn-finger protein
MAEAVVGGTKPILVELETGESYWWCQCGRSQDQPWCDGSHKGCGITPMEFTVEKTKRYALCTCKATAKGPFCDGSHKQVKTD